jgi:hypothetical protein
MLRGSSPIRLSQLDISPAIQAGALEQQAAVNLSSSINQAVENFQAKQEEKKQKEMTVSALRSFVPGLSEDLYKAAASDKSVRDNLMLFGREQAKAASELELAELKAQQPPKLSAQEEKIQIFQDTYGLSRQDAVDLAMGTKRLITDPTTQKSALVNVRTNEVTPVNVPREVIDLNVSDETLPAEDSPSSINLYQMAETTTGFFPLLSAKAQGITGQLGIDVADEELLENIQTFKTAQQDIIRSLRASPKILATEMNRLAQELDISPGVGKDVKTLRSQLKSIDKSINSRIQNIERLIADPNASAEDVRGARSLRNDLINFKRILGVPVDNEVFQGTSTQGLQNIDNIANKYLNQ